ncbi:hypothetical protein M0802_011778 [Mischocyttarus mexicanus]|nr:hypothetical protein M0802_011778 [Mischocyttarus mexicanus]
MTFYFLLLLLQSNRSQPAIGLKQTPKARRVIGGGGSCCGGSGGGSTTLVAPENLVPLGIYKTILEKERKKK